MWAGPRQMWAGPRQMWAGRALGGILPLLNARDRADGTGKDNEMAARSCVCACCARLRRVGRGCLFEELPFGRDELPHPTRRRRNDFRKRRLSLHPRAGWRRRLTGRGTPVALPTWREQREPEEPQARSFLLDAKPMDVARSMGRAQRRLERMRRWRGAFRPLAPAGGLLAPVSAGRDR
jgi:hypothetical protein